MNWSLVSPIAPTIAPPHEYCHGWPLRCTRRTEYSSALPCGDVPVSVTKPSSPSTKASYSPLPSRSTLRRAPSICTAKRSPGWSARALCGSAKPVPTSAKRSAGNRMSHERRALASSPTVVRSDPRACAASARTAVQPPTNKVRCIACFMETPSHATAAGAAVSVKRQDERILRRPDPGEFKKCRAWASAAGPRRGRIGSGLGGGAHDADQQVRRPVEHGRVALGAEPPNLGLTVAQLDGGARRQRVQGTAQALVDHRAREGFGFAAHEQRLRAARAVEFEQRSLECEVHAVVEALAADDQPFGSRAREFGADARVAHRRFARAHRELIELRPDAVDVAVDLISDAPVPRAGRVGPLEMAAFGVRAPSAVGRGLPLDLPSDHPDDEHAERRDAEDDRGRDEGRLHGERCAARAARRAAI